VILSGGGMDIGKRMKKWRRKADCIFEEQKDVLLHWVKGREAG